MLVTSPRSRIVHCCVCEDVELTDRTELPMGWLVTWDTGDTLCSSCLGNFAKRFGHEPEYLIKGEELSLFEEILNEG